MNASERRTVSVLAAILILRMTALFMVLPVIAPYALELAGSPMLAVGLAVGAYGLTQALLQIPLGALSDRIGRKPVIVAGLSIFALGSVMAATAESIQALVLARFMQGGGAIAAASTALLADLTRDQVRTTAMALIGASIGGSFLLALMLGPGLLAWLSVPALFHVSAIAALAAMSLVWFLPPEPQREPVEKASDFQPLWGLNLGVLALHAILAALFVGLPLYLQEAWQWELSRHWHLYLPVMILALLPVFPLIRWSERGTRFPALIPGAVVILLLSSVFMALDFAWLPLWLWAFFVAFNWLEASLPAWVSRLAPAAQRGQAMGWFASCQFFGAFAGASTAGWALSQWGASATLAVATGWALLWLLLLIVRNPMGNALSPMESETV